MQELFFGGLPAFVQLLEVLRQIEAELNIIVGG